MRAVSCLALLACFAGVAQAFTLTELVQIYANNKNVFAPYLTCDPGNYSNTQNCLQTSQYWATQNGLSPIPENNMPWPGAFDDGVNGLCYDYYRGYGENVVFTNYFNPSNNVTVEELYQVWDIYAQPMIYFFNETYFASLTYPSVISGGSVIVPDQGEPLLFNVSGTTYLQLLQAPAESICRKIAKEYITTTLNICNGACHGQKNETVDYAMLIMSMILFNPDGCYNDPDANITLSADEAARFQVLKDYNRGVVDLQSGECTLRYGPPVCGAIPNNGSYCDETGDEGACYGDYCEGGCTMSKNAWKKAKNAPTTWASFCPQSWMSSVPNYSNTLETTPYYNAPALTWAQMIDANPRGEACVVAAQQLMAAQLNQNCFLACSTTSVDSVMAELDALLNTYCLSLSQNSKGKFVGGFGKTNSTDRRRALLLADFLKSYNTGRYVGPGSCDSQDSLILAAAASAACGSSSSSSSSTIIAHNSGWAVTVIIGVLLTFIAVVVLCVFMWCLRDNVSTSANSGSQATKTVGVSDTTGQAQMMGAYGRSEQGSPFGGMRQRR